MITFRGIFLLVVVALQASLIVNAFAPSLGGRRIACSSSCRLENWALEAASKKRRRRRRKDAPAPETGDPPSLEKTPEKADAPVSNDLESSTEEEVDTDNILEVAKFKFEGEAVPGNLQNQEAASKEESDEAIPLPDIREALQKKQIEEELARAQEEEEEQRVRIKRSDKEAFARLLEQQPYADADDSYFEEEEYGTVSALLAEGAKPFLGIPSGPLQVGHFIGSLVIVLMAFIEYPGFPLTNLPSPLRGALQGGLGTVYAINIVLAVLAVFKAGERGQPAPLWVAKTFSVGGLAYDQLTQLPTLEQIEKAKARKGRRALKNKKK